MNPLELFCVFAVSVLVQVSNGEEGKLLARGFNDDINWVNLEEGYELAKESKKPMMILMHKSWCGACKALKPKFVVDKELEKLSEKFVMVNIMDDEEPNDRKFRPDGGYIPRIFFADHNGKISSIKNEKGNKQYEYFYSDTKQVLASMKTALEQFNQHGGEL